MKKIIIHKDKTTSVITYEDTKPSVAISIVKNNEKADEQKVIHEKE